MKKLFVGFTFFVLYFSFMQCAENNAKSLEVRIADAIISEQALMSGVTAFEESNNSRKRFIQSLLSSCNLNAQEIKEFKVLVRELRELLPVVFLLKKEFDRAYKQALCDAMAEEFAAEIAQNKGYINDAGRFVSSQDAAQYYDRQWQVIDGVNTQLEKNPKYSRYFKAQERLESINDQMTDFVKSLLKQAEIALVNKGESLKAAVGLYAGLMFNQLSDELLEVLDEQGN
jgi:hypothetical protein